MMQIGLNTELRHRQATVLTPKQLQYFRLLQFPNVELIQDIENTLQENPALEIEEVQRCPNCGEILLDGSPCITCLPGKADDSDRKESLSDEKLDMLMDIYSSMDGFYEASTYEAIPDDEFPDSFANRVRSITLEEHLKKNLGVNYPCLSDEDKNLAFDIIDMLDFRDENDFPENAEVDKLKNTSNPGLIQLTDIELAEKLDSDKKRVSRLRRLIAEMDPIGSGLENSIEVLALQAELADDLEKDERKALASIIRNYLELIGKEKFAQVAGKVGLNKTRVRELIKYAGRCFHWHPRRKFEETVPNAQVENTDIQPDVRIRELNGKFVVEVLDSGLPQLKISPSYAEAYRRMKNGSGEFSVEERKYIREKIESAKDYLDNLNSRRQTMIEITEEIIRQQEDFLRKGPLYHKKLTQKEVAEKIGVHASTVSRAVSSRYCQLPDNSIVPFSIFFDPSLCHIEMIKQILRDETPKQFFSDDEIRDIMAEKGHKLSRRVIAKYRKKGKIPSSGQRKRLLMNEFLKKGMVSEDEITDNTVEDIDDDEEIVDDVEMDGGGDDCLEDNESGENAVLDGKV